MAKITTHIKIKEYFLIAIRNLKNRRLRSWLTILGIVIGIFLIISLFSLSEGLKQALMQQLKMMRSDLIFVMPGKLEDIFISMLGNMELKTEEINVIKKTRGVEKVLVYPYSAEIVRYQNEAKIIFIGGFDWYEGLSILREDMGYKLKEGRFPIAGKKEVLVGNLIPKEIFSGLTVGDEISIKGRKLKVGGILMSLGNKQDDSIILLDLEDFQTITKKGNGSPLVIVKPQKGFSIKEVARNIEENLGELEKRRLRNNTSANFSVITSESWKQIISDILAIIQIVIIFFASIALIVGGVGIMNTMYTSVRERTREIGIMKAIGAHNFDIVMIFLIESGIIGVIGGIGGIILGIILAKIVELYIQFHPMFYLKASITPQLIIFGLIFSFLIGCLSGVLPAKKAAQLKPAEALRRFE